MICADETLTSQSRPIQKLSSLSEVLTRNIIGQDHVLGRVEAVLRRGELGLTHPRRPKGSFLFLGLTGVGKTELTLTFSRHLFGEGRVARFDMSEYQEQKSVGLFLGEHRNEEGIFGNRIKQANARVILFDEIEKSHPLVLDLFLQILDAGRITIATGETLDLTSFYIVATSNIGASNLMEMSETVPFRTLERVVFEQVDQQLRPELVGRFSEKLVFRRLTYDVQRRICLKVIKDEQERLARSGYQVAESDEAVEFLLRAGIHKRLGARPMVHCVERNIQNAIAHDLMVGGKGCGVLKFSSSTHSLVLSQEAGNKGCFI
jgi:ATP-dependent Clp protease ATP-binding subunit ClpA